MHTEVVIPIFPESIKNAEVTNIYVSKGQRVSRGDVLFDVEIDKVVIEVTACQDGIIEEFKVLIGEHVTSEQVVGYLREVQASDVPPTVQENSVLEELVQDNSGRVMFENLVGNSLFNERGILWGLVGLLVGLVFGGLGTVVMLG
ncbi:MAG: hypothetical protein HRT37_06740 [Alteromonadaceae bacterium]|nr:hypothetical protein [Alteromonadaceae bacterium]